MKTKDPQQQHTGKRTSSFVLLDFCGFYAKPSTTIITFNTFFLFDGRRPPLFIVFTITITLRRAFRDLQESWERNETSNCTIDDSEDKESTEELPVKYNCATTKRKWYYSWVCCSIDIF